MSDFSLNITYYGATEEDRHYVQVFDVTVVPRIGDTFTFFTNLNRDNKSQEETTQRFSGIVTAVDWEYDVTYYPREHPMHFHNRKTLFATVSIRPMTDQERAAYEERASKF